jgi:hypothetical protein
MSEGAGFTSMAATAAAGQAPEIGVGMLGYAFMGKAHSNAFKKIPYMMYPPPAIPVLAAICGRNAEATRAAALRFGYAKSYTDWQEMLADDAVQLFDGGPMMPTPNPVSPPPRAGNIFCVKNRWPAPPKKPKLCSTLSKKAGSSIWSPSTIVSCPQSARCAS